MSDRKRRGEAEEENNYNWRQKSLFFVFERDKFADSLNSVCSKKIGLVTVKEMMTMFFNFSPQRPRQATYYSLLLVFLGIQQI